MAAGAQLAGVELTETLSVQPGTIQLLLTGADLVSTWVTKQWRAYRGPVTSLINGNAITANDERYALAA
ncbi:hypothetical protein CO2235_60105 [Cupriavidus oxalaticus]|uniref:Uncharacterized protein n=1 Tax=Cupriavidus oxalaticus TaxID=96344 RepID=A0A375G9D4_9BURK|nr:hypothetical protein CO2235_60105 [Cupriavidus oxalaticus]